MIARTGSQAARQRKMLRQGWFPLEQGTHPPSDWGTSPCPTGESLPQAVDEIRDGAAVLFCDECQLPMPAHVFGLATGFGGRDCLLVVLDPLLNPPAALGEQTHEVLSLLVVGRCRHDSRSARRSTCLAGHELPGQWGVPGWDAPTFRSNALVDLRSAPACTTCGRWASVGAEFISPLSGGLVFGARTIAHPSGPRKTTSTLTFKSRLHSRSQQTQALAHVARAPAPARGSA